MYMYGHVCQGVTGEQRSDDHPCLSPLVLTQNSTLIDLAISGESFWSFITMSMCVCFVHCFKSQYEIRKCVVLLGENKIPIISAVRFIKLLFQYKQLDAFTELSTEMLQVLTVSSTQAKML